MKPLSIASILAVFVLAGPLAAGEFRRGDANQDGGVDISDPQFSLNFLFLGGRAPSCRAAADANDDEQFDISDPQFTLNFLFLGGFPPPPPFPEPGSDPTPGLGCGLAAPENLSCAQDGPAVLLSWELPEGYEAIEVSRQGEMVASLEGGASSFTDRPPRGGSHDYGVRGRRGDEVGDEATCRVSGLPPNEPPIIVLQIPAQGAVVSGDTVEVRGRVDDDRAVVRLRVAGEDVTPSGPPAVPYSFMAQVSMPPGPRLLRCEAVDDFGRATFVELALGAEPLLREGEATEGVALDIDGDTGYDEIEVIVRPFLDGVPSLVNDGVRGVRLYDGSFLGADLEVTGDRADVSGPLTLDLFPSSSAGGRVGMRVDIPEIRLFADGRTDFGFLGTDSWDATWTGRNVSLTGSFRLEPSADRSRLNVVSDGFTVQIGSSDIRVSGFLDPFGIFDSVVNLLAGLFEDQIEAEVKRAVETSANQALLPVIGEAFSSLQLNLDLGDVRLETTHHDVVESGRGLSLLFDATWRGKQRDPVFPLYPGSAAQFAPFPAFPLDADVSHPVDATICLSEDTLNQALHELVAGGLLESELELSGLGSPVPLLVGTLSVVEPRLASLPGISDQSPLGLRVRARKGPVIRLGQGVVGETLVAPGTTWRYAKGFNDPPSSWKNLGFGDSGWLEGASGFGYSSDPSELLGVATRLEDMQNGLYTSLYVRTAFELADPAGLEGLVLRVFYDDAFVAYLNGEEVARRNLDGEPDTTVSYDRLADSAIEPRWAEVDLTPFRGLLRSGVNVLALQGHNAASTSSDFVLLGELTVVSPRPAGVISALPVQIAVDELEVTFLADADADGVGETDADGVADEVDLLAYSLRFDLQAELLLIDDGGPLLVFSFESRDLSDPDTVPDAIVGGAAGLEVGVAMEVFDTDDEVLLEFAELIFLLFGPALGEALAGFELPTFPLPRLEFDLDQDGSPDVELEIAEASLVDVDTNGGSADWACVLSDLRPVAR